MFAIVKRSYNFWENGEFYSCKVRMVSNNIKRLSYLWSNSVCVYVCVCVCDGVGGYQSNSKR